MAIGRALADARLASGLSVDRLSEAVRLSPRQIEAIERADIEAFHSTGFYMLLLKHYASHMRFDEARVARVMVASSGSGRAARVGWLSLAVVMFLLLLTGAAFLGSWFGTGRTTGTTTSSAGVAPDDPARIPAIVFSPASLDPEPGKATPDAAAKAAPSGDAKAPLRRSAAPAAATVSMTPGEPEPPIPPGAFGLLRAQRDTWMFVRDATDSVTGRSLKAGAALTLDSRPRFLIVGDPSAELIVATGKVDVSRYVVNGEIRMGAGDFDPPALDRRARPQSFN
jgi:hypothetical protein